MKKILIFLFWLIVYFLASSLGTIILIKALKLKGNFNIVGISVLVQLLLIVIIMYINRKKLKKDLKSLKVDHIKTGLGYWFKFLIISITINFLINVLGAELPLNESVNRNILETAFLPSIISFLIVGPLIEELIFRFSLRKAINNKKIFIIVSGLLFGLSHMMFQNLNNIFAIIQVLNYSLMGMAFAAIYTKTDNIWSSILIHSFHNLIAVLSLLMVK